MWTDGDRWFGRLEVDGLREGEERPTVEARTRDDCLARLREAADGPLLTVEVMPEIAGVAEAAAIMGWDKRRVITYLDRDRFPRPIASLASGRVWRRADVEAFARQWRARRRRRP